MTDTSTETQLNEGISQILDSEKTCISTQRGILSLRDVLTAVFRAQETDTRWFSKILGKRQRDPRTIILHLPKGVGEYINLSEGGHYLGFYNQVLESLELLTVLGLISANRYLKLEGEEGKEEWIPDATFGITSAGKAFVNYSENQEK